MLSLNPNFDLDLSGPLHKFSFTQEVERTSMDLFITKWLTTLNSTTGTSGKGRNKLRTYRTFKHEFKTKEYCKLILPPSHRSALCKFRCGVAPIRIETGRFENLKLDERKCPFCSAVEDESHVLLECDVYNDLRTSLFLKAVEIQPNFLFLSKPDQLSLLLSNLYLKKICAKTCLDILKLRSLSVSK